MGLTGGAVPTTAPLVDRTLRVYQVRRCKAVTARRAQLEDVILMMSPRDYIQFSAWVLHRR